MNFQKFKHYLFSFVVIILFICCFLSITASAAWDGQGDSTGGNGSVVSGDFNLPTTDADKNILGYRFSIYNKDGTKVGNGIDLYFSGDTKYYRNTKANKKGHMEYYAEYDTNGNTSLGGIKYLAPPTTIVYAGLPKNPTDMETWLDDDIAYQIAMSANAEENFNIATSYIIVEPLYEATLAGEGPYSLTLAEYAVYQSTQYGWKKEPPTNIENSYSAIASRLGATFPRHLYAVKEYNVFPTLPITAPMLSTRPDGVEAILVTPSESKYTNTAENILKYQMGMGIYTSVKDNFFVEYRNEHDANDGEGIMADDAITYGVKTPLSANEFTREQYKFTGWIAQKKNKDLYKGYNSSGTLGWYSKTVCDQYGYDLYDDQQVIYATVPIGETVTMWAQWEPAITLTVNYYSNSANSAQYKYVSIPGVSSSTNIKVHTQVFEKDKNYPNGLSNTQNNEYLYLRKYGYKPIKGKEWNTTADGTGAFIDENKEYTGQALAEALGVDISKESQSVNVYVQWEPITYTIEFRGNGATSGSMEPMTMTYDVADNLTTNGFKRTGYTFVGWNTKSQPDEFSKSYENEQEVKNLTTVDGETITLYAQWEVHTLTVNYYTNGADFCSINGSEVDITSSQHIYTDIFKYNEAYSNGLLGGQKDDRALLLTRESYLPTGKWGTTADGGVLIDEDTGFASGQALAEALGVDISKESKSVNVYAQWTPNLELAYTIKFNGNGATSGSMKSMIMMLGESKALNANSFNKTGYTFSHWNAEADGSGTSYENKQEVKDLAYPGEEITLFAQWKPNPDTKYTVNHHLMNLDGSTYALKETEKLTGTTGTSVTLKDLANTYTGFTYKEGKVGGTVVKTTTILADGSRVIDLYYTRNQYTVTLNKGTGISSVSGAGTYYYGEEVTINATVSTGYSWSKWTGTHDTATKQFTFTMPANDVEDTANATAIGYKITYDENGGSAVSDLNYTIENSVTLAEAPTKTGYTFAGWKLETSAGNWTATTYTAEQKIGTGKYGNITLVAQWEPIKYTIVFNGNSATSGSTASMTMTYDVAKNLTTNGFYKTGHTFTGWNTKADGSGTSYTDKQEVKNLTTVNGATIILYAQWANNTYTIKFDGNGATSGSTPSMSLEYGETKPLNENGFEKPGYTFSHWNTEPDNSGDRYEDKEEVKDLGSTTLYAQWKPITYTIVFNGNSATSGSTASMSMTYDVAKNLTTNGFKKTNHAFVNWNTKADGSGTSYKDEQEVKNLTTVNGATITLYAQWANNTYTIKFDGNGATSGSTESMIMMLGESKALNANGFKKTGYTFVGWNTKENGEGSSYVDKAIVKDLSSTAGTTVTLYAQWEPIKYTIVFNGNSATSGSTASMTMTYDVAKNLTANGFYKTGHTFTGWNTKADGSGTSYADKQEVKDLGPTTLYAQWEPLTYTIKFNGNGATHGSTASMSMTYDIAKNLTANGFYKTGHTFTGWNTKADGSGTSYTNKQEVKNLTTVKGAIITLYAQWEPEITSDLIDIIYDGNGATTGTGWKESFDIAANTSYTLSANSNAFSRIETDAVTGVNSLFKFMGWKIGDKVYNFGEKIPTDVLAANLGSDNTVIVYAYWDEHPIIEAIDRWFSLDDAQSGKITLEEIFKFANAIDGDVGDVTDFENSEGIFTVINFDANEFKKFTATGSVTITYQAVDKVGNETYRTITIYIVGNEKLGAEDKYMVRHTRFVSPKYFKNSDGSYVLEENGGLNANSVWIHIFEYEKTLTETLSNKKDTTTGKWNKVYHTWSFTKEQIAEVKVYVAEHGLGNSKENDALANFYNLFEPT